MPTLPLRSNLLSLPNCNAYTGPAVSILLPLQRRHLWDDSKHAAIGLTLGHSLQPRAIVVLWSSVSQSARPNAHPSFARKFRAHPRSGYTTCHRPHFGHFGTLATSSGASIDALIRGYLTNKPRLHLFGSANQFSRLHMAGEEWPKCRSGQSGVVDKYG